MFVIPLYFKYLALVAARGFQQPVFAFGGDEDASVEASAGSTGGPRGSGNSGAAAAPSRPALGSLGC